jgi:hypothetical protein
MSNQSKVAGLLCGLVLLSAVGLATPAPSPAKKAPRKPAVQKKVEPPAPAPTPVIPQPPPTPEQMPATPPNVAMNNGLMTITADNSTLSDVLTGIRRATGASIDVPPSAANDRVVVHLGPGQPPDVLRQLLTGSKFDYIIIGSPQNSTVVQRVILTARGNAGAVPGTPQQAAQAPAQGYQPPEEPVEDDSNNQPEPEPTPEVTLPPQPPPGQPVPQPQQQGPKSPEQLLQELQQMQRQQRPERNPQPQ